MSASSAQAQPGPGLRVDGQSLVADANGEFTAQLSATGLDLDRLDQYSIAIVFYTILEDEAELDIEPSRPINRVGPTPFAARVDNRPPAPTAPKDAITFEVAVPIRSGEAFDDIERVRLPDPGVYPISIELFDGGILVASKRLNLFRASEDGAIPTTPKVSFVLGFDPRETTSEAEILDLLASYRDIPISVLLDHETISDLLNNPERADRWRQGLGDRVVTLVAPREVDPSSLEAIGHSDIYSIAVDRLGVDTSQIGLVIQRDQVALSTPLTIGGARLVAANGTKTVLDLVGGSASGLVTDQEALGVATVSYDRLVGIETIINNQAPSDPTAEAINLMTRLIMRATKNTRPVLLTNGIQSADPQFWATLFDASQSGDLESSSIADVAKAGEGNRVEPMMAPVHDLSLLAAPLDKVTKRLGQYRSIYVDGPNGPSRVETRIVDALIHGTDGSESRLSQIQALNQIEQELDQELQLLTLADARAVTVAAQSAQIPLIIDNQTGGSRQVQLRFRSDKIQVANQGEVVVVGPGSSPISLDVEARTLGISSVDVSIWTPDGAVMLDQTRLEVRSTAVPGVGFGLAGISLAVLGVWWIVHHRRARARRSEHVNVVL